MSKRGNPEGYVYVISNPCMPGLYKIGSTRDISARLKSLSIGTMVPDEFVLEAIYRPDSYWANSHVALERQVHRYFTNFRVKKNREFFEINLDDLKRHIRRSMGYGSTPLSRDAVTKHTPVVIRFYKDLRLSIRKLSGEVDPSKKKSSRLG